MIYQFSGHCAMVVKGASGVAGSSHGTPSGTGVTHGEPLKRYLSVLSYGSPSEEGVSNAEVTDIC